MKPQEIVLELTNLGCLVEKDALSLMKEEDLFKIKELSVKPLLINSELVQNLHNISLEQLQNKTNSESERSEFKIIARTKRTLEGKVEFENPYVSTPKKRDVALFVKQFNDRFDQMKTLLLKRRELKNAISIANVNSNQKEVTIIAMVDKIYKTRKEKYILTVEDITGTIKVYCSPKYGDRICEDDVIGFIGKPGDGIIFARDVLWPEIPLPSHINATKDEVYAAFISDLHFGSKQILTKKLKKFLTWINSNHKIAEKVLYICVTGDLVDGVGKYPGQDKNLKYKDIYRQYDDLSNFVSSIPENIQIVLLPGDHDVVRMAEPQPPIPKKYIPELSQLNNVHLAPNPCYVNLHGMGGAPISVLLNHGYYYHGHIDALPEVRKQAEENPTKVMVDLLRRRHLAPIYGTRSTLIAPEDKDYLTINKIPDIFSLGHLHSFAYSNYKGINLICASTFQAETDFQRRIGHVPDPGKVALINLKTREAILKAF